MDDKSSALTLAFQMGETLLKNGAEIFRVQETMERVAKAYNAQKFDVYVLTNAIFATGIENGVQRSVELKHVPSTTIHLGRVALVNQLSREIAEGKVGVSEAFERLDKIKVAPFSSLPLATAACAVGSACFSFLFGGSIFDALTAFLCGIVLELFIFWANRHKLSKFSTNILASALVTLCGALLFMAGLGNDMDKIIIGSIIRLVPGVALTTSIRDFINGDYLSGSIRMLDAFLIGGSIAIGVGVVVRLMSVITGGALL